MSWNMWASSALSDQRHASLPNYRAEPIWAAMMAVNFLARSCIHRSLSPNPPGI